VGRPSIAPEKLLRGSLIQAFYTIRSERQLMEQLDYNLLFRWFVGLGIGDPVWDHSTYSKNRDRLLEADIARKFLTGIVEHPKVKPLLSDGHFTVDGTLVAAWASMKASRQSRRRRRRARAARTRRSKPSPTTTPSQPRPSQPRPSQPRQRTPPRCRATRRGREAATPRSTSTGQKRCNATHASTTDPEARLYRKGKGKEAKLSFMGHALAENRHGLIVETGITQATGTAEREAAKAMIESHSPGSTRRLTLGADKAYDAAGFVAELRAMCVTPHVAQNTSGRSSAVDGRTTRHKGYALSQRCQSARDLHP
jgi:transposase-like protein DUF772